MATSAHLSSVHKPKITELAYGTHQRTVLDFWKAPSDTSTPLGLVIHGGGQRNGSKQRIIRFVELPALLQAEISVTAVNYRYIRNSQDLKPPVQGPFHDAARALQFIRTKAAE